MKHVYAALNDQRNELGHAIHERKLIFFETTPLDYGSAKEDQPKPEGWNP